MGIIIMGNDFKDLVVDSDCCSYDYKNLFIVSSSVMFIVGLVNCILMIVVFFLCIVEIFKVEV